MAKLPTPKTQEEVKETPIATLRRDYLKLGEYINKISNKDMVYCHQCDSFLARGTFYTSKEFASGLYPVCKKCLLREATDYDKSAKIYKDNKEKTKQVLKKMNLPFYESLYLSSLSTVQNAANEKNRLTAWSQYITIIKSLPTYSDATWADSEFDNGNGGVESEVKRSPRKEIKKLFGSGFSTEDYLYLQDQYDDWYSRVDIAGKSQEVYIIRICFKLLDLWKAQRSGKPTKDLDASLNALMLAANLQPKQSVDNTNDDNLTFGQMIEKWENEEPVPEPEGDFKDVDKIGKYIRVWFTGCFSKAMGLKNIFSKEFDEEISKYTVNKPEYEGEENPDEIYNKIFGKAGDE